MKKSRLTGVKQSAGWMLALLALATVGVAAAILLAACPPDLSRISGIPASLLFEIGLILSGLIFAAVGRLLTLYRPENPIGWLLFIPGLALPLTIGFSHYIECAGPGGTLPYASLVAWVMMILGTLLILALFILLPSLFPTGTFISKSWRRAVGLVSAILIFLTLLAAAVPGPMTLNGMMGEISLDNPFGLPLPGLRSLENILFYGIPFTAILGGLVGIAAFISRFRRSSGDERQQLKWFAYFLATVVVIHLIGFEFVGGLFYPAIFEHWSYSLILFLSFSGFPLVIGLAILKYRLYDIDLIIRRTLLYALVTGSLVLVYFGMVTVLQSFFATISGQQSPLAIVISTLAIAALFNPLRIRLQGFIDRRFYRSRYDAAQTLEEFAASLRQEVDLDAISQRLLAVTAESMQPEHASLWLRKGDLQG